MSTIKDLHRLPQISLSKLYNYIDTHQKSNKSSSFSKSYTNCQEILTSAHHDGIKVQSPFYERHQDLKGTCTCAYHRMKRYKQQPKLMKDQRNDKIKMAINQYKMRIAAAVKASNEYKNTLNGEFLKKNLKGLINFSNSRNFQRVQNKKESLTDKEKERERETIDHYNYMFEEILRKRLSSFGNNQKVDHLIKFIKMKSSRQPTYLKKIRDYLYLHLMKVAQKIPLDDLLNLTDDSTDLISKIAQMINSSEDVARQFVKAIQKASKDLESYLNQLTKEKQLQQQQRKIKEDRKSFKQNDHKQVQNGQNKENRSIRHNSSHHSKKQEISEKKKQDQINESNQIKQKVDFAKRYDNLLKIQLKKKKSSMVSNININDSSSSRKKSKRSQVLSFGTQKQVNQKLKGTDEDNIKQIKSKRQIIKQDNLKQKQNQKQKQNEKNRLSKMNQLANMRKSKFSTTKNYKIVEIKQQEMEQKEFEKHQLELNSRKKGKSRIIQKPNPFISINYSFLLNNEQFQKIKGILKAEETPSLEQQRMRMRKLFNFLLRKIQNNPQFLQEFIKIFKSVLSEQQISILRKKFADNLLRIMIQKLTKQLDDCILQVHQNEKSTWKQQQEIEQAKRQKEILIKKSFQFESVHQNEALIDQFNKFTIIQNIPLPVPLVELQPLEQTQLGELVLQSVNKKKERKSRNSIVKLRKSRSTFKQEYRFNSSIDEQKHLRILRYMRNKYPSAFNQVQTNIKDALENNSLVF